VDLFFQVLLNDPMEMEQPEYLSLPQKILVYSQITVKGQRLSTSVTLPIHLRYHRSESEGGYVKVIQKHPEIFLRCDGKYSVLSLSYGLCCTRAQHLVNYKSLKGVWGGGFPCSHVKSTQYLSQAIKRLISLSKI
jgi:hypothetical protein